MTAKTESAITQNQRLFSKDLGELTSESFSKTAIINFQDEQVYKIWISNSIFLN